MFVGSFVALGGSSPTLVARLAFFAPLRLSPRRLCALGGLAETTFTLICSVRPYGAVGGGESVPAGRLAAATICCR